MELVYYDGQTHPATVPRIYTKLLDVDKVDLVISGYATNLIAPLSPSRWSARRPSWVCSGSPITRGAPTSRLSRRLTPLLARANLGALAAVPAPPLGGAAVTCSRCRRESHLPAIYLAYIAALTCS